jgi:hypothetical protein
MNLRVRNPKLDPDGCAWAERCMRVLSVHYFAPQLDLILEHAGPVYIYAGTHEICRGDSLGEALEHAISQLSDAELIAAIEVVGEP